jgi:hypothetical protein
MEAKWGKIRGKAPHNSEADFFQRKPTESLVQLRGEGCPKGGKMNQYK